MPWSNAPKWIAGPPITTIEHLVRLTQQIDPPWIVCTRGRLGGHSYSVPFVTNWSFRIVMYMITQGELHEGILNPKHYSYRIAWHKMPASVAQIQFLQRCKIKVRKNLSRGAAAALTDEMLKKLSQKKITLLPRDIPF